MPLLRECTLSPWYQLYFRHIFLISVFKKSSKIIKAGKFFLQNGVNCQESLCECKCLYIIGNLIIYYISKM